MCVCTATSNMVLTVITYGDGGGGAPVTGPAKGRAPLRQGPATTKKQKKDCVLEEVVVCGECRDDCMTREKPTVNTSTIFTNRVTVILTPSQEDIPAELSRRARVVSTISMLDTGATESNFI